MKAYRVLALTVLLQSPAVFAQGSLNPPGPPNRTMKTLEQIEPRYPIMSVPYVITGAGSYYLTASLTNSSSSSDSIQVHGQNITIDLGGFTLSSLSGNISAINLAPEVTNVKIVNGVLHGHSKSGINGASASSVSVREVRVSENGSGMSLGSGALIEQCSAISNLNNGINVGPASHIRGSVSIASGNFGFSAGDGSTFVDCISSYSLDGFITRNSSLANCSAYTNVSRGFNASQGSQFVNCIAIANGFIGFSGSGEISMLKCVARGNGDCGVALFKVFGQNTSSIIRDSMMVNNVNFGLLAQARATVFDSTADFNQLAGMQFQEQGSAIGCTVVSNRVFGISAAAGSLVQDCMVTRNGSTGILGDPGTRVIGCNVFSNGVDGINVRTGSTVSRCTARANGDDGIEVETDCVVSENHCTGNGTSSTTTGAGIHATSPGNRVEGNHAVQNENGYRIDGANSTLFRNTARGNTTNWVIAAGNDVGPIGAAATATSPFANIEF